ncbi:hypothetical protein KDI_44590 [Dictyobacter arantiisoli]|uniref:Uncharacterized protein n=1 Tax=Dictyobacter arantiisoli TaxID=2014874 RepID=A0A5A5TI53_9CHLR|nr:hypothetical protein KDI_44590 [Dictyobacter arantiisoli]
MICPDCGQKRDEHGWCYCDKLPPVSLVVDLCPDCGCIMDELGGCEVCEEYESMGGAA